MGDGPACGVQRHLRAFSLVEVVIALGIIAFAMIPIFSLLPIGLSMQRDSMESTLKSQVFQTIVGDLQRANFSELAVLDDDGNPMAVRPEFAPGNANIRFFDDEGRELADADDSKRLLDVQTTLVFPAILPGAVQENHNLIQAEIRIAMNPGRKAADELFSAAPRQFFRRFAFIARTID